MGSSSMDEKKLEMFEIGPCEDSYQLGGRHFIKQIKSRLATDQIFQQLLPFAQSPQSQPLVNTLEQNNSKKFPNYWNELLGIAEGSGVPVLQIVLLNFRKEILPFISRTEVAKKNDYDTNDDCSDILVVSDSMAIAA